MQIRGFRGNLDAYDALVDSVCLEIVDLLVDKLGFDYQYAQTYFDRGYVKSVMDWFV